MPTHFWMFIAGIIIFFVLWALIQIIRETRKKSLNKALRDQFSGYIKFIASYEKATKAEEQGDLNKALEHYQSALQHLKLEQRKNNQVEDKLVEKNIEELEHKINHLRQSLN